MTVRTPSDLKALFETGDRPTQTDFSDLIDTFIHGVIDVVRDHSADSTGTTDSTTAIQAALEASAAGTRNVFVPSGTFIVSPQTFAGIGGIFGANSVCVFVSADTKFFGPGVLQLASGASVGSGAIIGCKNTNDRANIIIDGLGIDGNQANTTGSCSGIVLVNASNSKITNNDVHDTTLLGVAIKTEVSAVSVIKNKNNLISGNYIHDTLATANALGIQTDYSEGTRIVFNRIEDVGDNGIGVFGDDAAGPLGLGNIVEGNSIKNCLNGIFFESDGESVIANNYVEGVAASAAGISLNTSNSFSRQTNVTGNILRTSSQVATSGIRCRLGDTHYIHGNHMDGFKWGIRLNDGAKLNNIGRNTYENILDFLVYAERGTNEMVQTLVERQVYASAQDSDRWPKAYFDTMEPESSARYSGVTFEQSGWSLESNNELSVAFYYGTNETDQNAAWASAYSLFTAGETLVKASASGGVLVSASERIRLNGEYFIVHSRAGAVITIRSTASTAGDFTAVTNTAATVFAYTSAQFARLVTE